ncbi:MAG: S41 family peptidase [Candidatus Electrothrix sp. AR3]|nr:S41 family peptidase [Candidatus Electrothrix sp. AR3]
MRFSFFQHTVLTALLALALSAAPLLAAGQEETEIYTQLETFANILDLLQKHYVDEVNSTDILIGAVNGMLSTLDPHSSYMSPNDFKELQEDTRGSFSGIGIEVTIRHGLLTVVSPIAGTPAFKEGIKAGDKIIKINDQSTKGMTLADGVKLLRGRLGEEVSISITSEGQQNIRNITLVRDTIPHHSVIAMELGNALHYIQITNFQNATTRDFKKALQKAEKKSPIKGLLLDLRNNPGGLLDQAVEVADVLLDQGVIVSTRGRAKEDDLLFEAHSDKKKYHFPMIVLVNGGSASASEIVAGALQDHQKALILGTRTFGKGSVQTVVPLPDGAGLRLTTARYYTPSGDSIQETGIIPDMIIPLQAEEGENKKESKLVREKDLPHHLKNNDLWEKEKEKEKGNEKKIDSNQQKIDERLAVDNQLRAALFLLQNLY